jgi:hypothetical protein
MPTIELTDEQAEELRDLLESEIQYVADVYADDEANPDAVQEQHRASVLSDILHLLEIA